MWKFGLGIRDLYKYEIAAIILTRLELEKISFHASGYKKITEYNQNEMSPFCMFLSKYATHGTLMPASNARQKCIQRRKSEMMAGWLASVWEFSYSQEHIQKYA